MDSKELIRFLGSLERFLSKNEGWFQKPEERIAAFEKEMQEWDKQFLEGIGNVELLIKELEKRME
jgi:hypothetical protein